MRYLEVIARNTYSVPLIMSGYYVSDMDSAWRWVVFLALVIVGTALHLIGYGTARHPVGNRDYG